MTPTPHEIAATLWSQAGLPEGALPEGALAALTITGHEPVLPSSFRVAAAAAATIGAAGLAAAEIFRARTGRGQSVSVDLRHASAEFRSEQFLRDARTPPGERWDPIAGTYRCGDGRWVRLHTNFPHHRAGVLALLKCDGTREAVGAALATWQAEAFETAATQAHMCVAMMRSFAEWDAHPHAQAVADVPFEIVRIGDAPPVAFSAGANRPLSGVRVLDLTRVLAGPIAGRTLAAHGADVLHITGPGVPNFPALILDTGRGKRAAELDLRTADGRAALRGLAGGADVFLQSYRAGALAARGFSAQDLAEIQPGIVAVTLSAYGETGAWGGKRGYDSLVQTATGFNHAEAAAAGIEGPKPLPCQALDHASGYLLAFAAMAALRRRAIEGGSWEVRVTLAGTGRWLRGLGRLADGLQATAPTDVADLLETAGPISAIRHAAVLSETPAEWVRPAQDLGSGPACW